MGFGVWGFDFRVLGSRFKLLGVRFKSKSFAYCMNCLANSLTSLVISPSCVAAPSAAAHALAAATARRTTAALNGKFMVVGLAGVVRAGVCSRGQWRRALAAGGKE